MKYILKSQTCEETGMLGLVLANMPLLEDEIFVARDGLVIAHDIVEHESVANIGTIADELRAVGAIWEVRGRWGDVVRGNGPGSALSSEEHVAAELAQLFDKWVGYSNYVDERPVLKSRGSHITSSFDEAFPYLWNIAKGMVEVDNYTGRQEEMFKAWALAEGRKGVRSVCKRWGDALFANTVLWNITEEVDKALKWVEFEGQEFELVINKQNGHVRCSEVEYDYDW